MGNVLLEFERRSSNEWALGHRTPVFSKQPAGAGVSLGTLAALAVIPHMNGWTRGAVGASAEKSFTCVGTNTA